MEFIKKYKFRILLSLIFVGGILTRILFLDKDNLWRDESFTVNAASSSFPDLINTLISDSHPPFHLLLLHGIIKVFGNSEFIVRLPSALFGIGSIFVVYLIAKRFLQRQSSILLSVFIFALNPFLIVQSREARQYSILLFFFSLAIYFYLKILSNRNKKDYIFFMLSLILCCYTHYIGIIIFISLSTLLLLNKKLDIKTHVLTSLLLIPQIALFVYQYLNVTGSDSEWLIFHPIYDIFINSFRIFIGERFESEPLIVVFQIILIPLLSYSLFVTIKNYTKLGIIAALLNLNVFVKALVWLISFVNPLFYGRYISFLTVSVSILIGKSQEFMTNKVRIVFISTLVICYVVIGMFNLTQYDYPNYKRAIEFIGNEEVIHISPESFHSFRYYKKAGKILGEKNQFQYFQGTAATSDEDFTKNLPESFYLASDMYIGANENNYNLIKSQGYSSFGKHEFRGIIIELWKKIN